MASDEEEEEYLVHVDFDAVLENDIFNKPNLFFKVIGIDTEKPVMQIEDQVFVGDYRDVPGTTLFFEEDPNPVQDDPVFGRNVEKPLKYVCKTRKSLVMRRVFVKKKDPKDISIDTEDESLTDEDELSESDQFPQSPSNLYSDSSKYSSDPNIRMISDLHKLQKYDIVDTKYKKRHVKRKLSHSKTKKIGSKGKSKGKEKEDVDEGSISSFSPEPVAGPSWLPDNVPEVNAQMLVEESNPNVHALQGNYGNVKRSREMAHKETKTSGPKEDTKVLLERFVKSVDSAVEAMLKDTGMILSPDKTKVIKDPNYVPKYLEFETESTSAEKVDIEPPRQHINTEEMSRLIKQQMTLKCSSDLKKNGSGSSKPD